MARTIAQTVYDAVIFDSAAMLSPACFVDYGLDIGDFQGKFGALQNAARKGATVEEFDDVLGSGLAITELVAKYGSNVIFSATIWDLLEEEEYGPDWDNHIDQQAKDNGYSG